MRAGLVLLVVLVADQAVKGLVTSSLDGGETRDIVLGIKLVNVRNTGVAFGQLQNGGVIVSVFIALALFALVVYFTRHAGRPLIWLPTGMLLGGALGNIVDRIREGAVVDFVKLPYWPAFNVADAAITIGVVMLLFVIERDDGARGPS
ncbi:MAG: signal peptidase [Solirubrobacteraceae bacterium]|jgi:signal peptidase II|nr:signal peptidase [Solirubrobacteraceae bacterium]